MRSIGGSSTDYAAYDRPLVADFCLLWWAGVGQKQAHVNDLALASNHRSIAIDTSLRAMGLFAALLESLLLLAASLGSQPLSCSGGLVFCAQRRRFQSEGV